MNNESSLPKLKNARLVFLILITLFSIFILYPKNIKELFYYDDNPIRYMIAKSWAEGKLTYEDKKFFLTFGSADIYIPSFYFAKYFGISYEVIYNITSIALLLLGLTYIFIFSPKEWRHIIFTLPLLAIFGIICVKKGSVHWFISSSILVSAIISSGAGLIHFVPLGIAYFISPPLIILTVIFSLPLLRYGERKKLLLITLPTIIALPKLILVWSGTSEEAKKALGAVSEVGRDAIGATYSYAPLDYQMFLRPLILDYVDNSFVLGIAVYVILARAILTKDRFSLSIFALFYISVLICLSLFKLWKSGYGIPEFMVIPSVLISSSNPFRYAPVFISYLIAKSERLKYDTLLGSVIISSFLISSIITIVKGKGELPQKLPFDVKLVIHILRNMDGKNILVEGDIHMFDKGKLVHPLYNSHILSYISSEVENKNFYGGIFPWKLHSYNFFAGKFNSRELEESNVRIFIKERSIDIILCWTDKCKEFFNEGRYLDIDKIRIIKLRN